jgi:DNA-binding response OmpR family regulator
MTQAEKTMLQKSRKILVVEDDAAMLQVINGQLQSHGYETVLASSADEAEAILNEQLIPIVICDKNMPRRSGLDLCRSLRQNPKTRGVYFIMITALGTPDEKVRALNEGVDDYLSKSPKPNELLARLKVAHRILDLQEQIVELERAAAAMAVVNTLAHEINNPLTGLLGFLELAQQRLNRTPLNEENLEKIKKMLERVHEQGKRIEAVVKKLMELRQYSTKTYLNNIEMIDLSVQMLKESQAEK